MCLIQAQSQSEEDKLQEALAIMSREDPSLVITRDAETGALAAARQLVDGKRPLTLCTLLVKQGKT